MVSTRSKTRPKIRIPDSSNIISKTVKASFITVGNKTERSFSARTSERIRRDKIASKKRKADTVFENKESTLIYPPVSDWEKTYNIIKVLRSDRTAPVDYYGSEALPEKGANFAYQTLIALMLSSQTKDEMVAKVMKRLQSRGLTMRSIMGIEESELSKTLYGVGFYNMKARYIKKSTELIMEKYEGQVPNTFEGLTSLPGVGPKMALLVLQVAFNKQIGISVDTHVHRICAKLGWTSNCKTPEKTRKELEKWLPKSKWGEINLLFVGFGQELQSEKSKLIKKCLALKCPEERRLGHEILMKLGVKFELPKR